jgi:hypothetical protein
LDWLRSDGDRTEKEFLQRLQNEYPGEYADEKLRTLQPRVKAWRSTEARRLILAFPPDAGGPGEPDETE